MYKSGTTTFDSFFTTKKNVFFMGKRKDYSPPKPKFRLFEKTRNVCGDPKLLVFPSVSDYVFAEQVEAKIQEWVRDYTEKTGTEVPVPDGGFLNAGVNFNGKQLGDGSLLENDIPDMATLSVGPGEAAAEAEE